MPEKILPWSETCFVCGDANPRGLGARFEADEAGRVRLSTVLDQSFEGFAGHVHGGVITALLDEAAGWACAVAVGRFCLTARIAVTFRKPVPGGEKVLVVAEDLGSKGPFRRGRATISDAAGTELAVAEGMFSPIEEKAALPFQRQANYGHCPAAL